MRLKVEIKSGPTVDLTPSHVWPLDIDDLLRSKEKNAEFQLKIEASDPLVDGIVQSGVRTATASIKFNESMSVYALVDGGWLPPPFLVNPCLLVDRNVVSVLSQYRRGIRNADVVRGHWWLNLLDREGLLFNPIPYAMEGHQQKPPTIAEFDDSYAEASREIQSLFPKANVIRFNQSGLRTAYGAVLSLYQRTEMEMAYLLDVVPHLIDAVPSRKLRMLRQRLLDSATVHKLDHGSMLVMCVLSCLYGDAHTFPVGRKILKPSKRYTVHDAYNALADLRHIELFMATRGVPDARSFSLCTCDYALAAFWCAICVSDVEIRPGEMSYSLSPKPVLFPRLRETGVPRPPMVHQ